MNPRKQLKRISGTTYPKTFAQEDELEKLPKKKIKGPAGEEIEVPDMEGLEKETVGNVIMNCLATYKPEDRKETIYVNMAMELFLDAEDKEIEVKEKLKEFIVKVLVKQTVHDEMVDTQAGKVKQEVGIYYVRPISQCLAELGIKEEV